MKRLAIVGAGGHGKVVADAAEQCGWDKIEFFDDRWPSFDSNSVWPVVGSVKEAFKRFSQFDGVFVAIGDNRVRLEKVRLLASAGACVVSIIHPKAIVSPYSVVGSGCVLMAGSVVNIDAVLGDGVIINTGATVDHDCTLGDGVHVSPGAQLAGNVAVKECGWIGIGATVNQCIIVGEDVIVGASSAVVKDVVDDVIVVGVPAKPLLR